MNQNIRQNIFYFGNQTESIVKDSKYRPEGSKVKQLSSMNLPKTVLFSPGQCEEVKGRSKSNDNKVIGQATFNEVVRVDARECQQEAHQNRIKNLRKELEYLKNTNWKYQPIEKIVGQS